MMYITNRVIIKLHAAAFIDAKTPATNVFIKFFPIHATVVVQQPHGHVSPTKSVSCHLSFVAPLSHCFWPLSETIEDKGSAPQFTKLCRELEVIEDDRVCIDYHVVGRPEPQVTWFRNGRRLEPDHRIRIVKAEGKPSLVIEKARLSDTGTFTCVAKNVRGEAVFEVGTDLD